MQHLLQAFSCSLSKVYWLLIYQPLASGHRQSIVLLWAGSFVGYSNRDFCITEGQGYCHMLEDTTQGQPLDCFHHRQAMASIWLILMEKSSIVPVQTLNYAA